MNYSDLPFISLVTENQKAFGDKVISIADEISFLPHWLMIVMKNESGINHRIKNPNGSATGLIQFTEATAGDLGTSTAALKAMSNVEQLDFVKKYFTKYGYDKKIKDVADTYLAVFYPAALWKEDSFIFPQWATDGNPIFDVNKDHVLTKAEFKNYVNQKYAHLIPQLEVEELESKKKNKVVIAVIVLIVIIAIIGAAIYYSKKKK